MIILDTRMKEHAERTDFPMSPDDGLKFQGSLKSLMLTVRKRVTLATASIQQFDDPAVIDREMRFLRPFWEFIQTRQKLNRNRYWEARQRDLFSAQEALMMNKTPLVWLPDRPAVCNALEVADDRERLIIISLLRGIEIVIFNFTTLLSRSRHTLGIEDPESFQIVTTESHPIDGYRLLRSTIKRTSPENGEEYKVITTRFILPNKEEIKIEKDFSQSLTDPQVEIRLTADRSGRQRGSHYLEYLGRQSELNQRSGRLMTTRL